MTEARAFWAPDEIALARRVAAAQGLRQAAAAVGRTYAATRLKLASMPRPPQGPSGRPADPLPDIPEGHELAGMSTLADGAGKVSARWAKTRAAGAVEPPVPIQPAGHHVRRTSTMLRPDGTTGLQWVSTEPQKEARDTAIRESWERLATSYAGLAKRAPAPRSCDADLCAVYAIGDPHIGMLSWAPETGADFDLTIARRELVECMGQLVDRTPAAETAIVLQLGDFYHSQDDLQRTPGHGHKLDVDGRFPKVLDVGHEILTAIFDGCRRKHKRTIGVMIPGNHDPNMAHALAAFLRQVYKGDPRVQIDPSLAPYWFHEFGANLIAAGHGDGAKENALPLLLAARQPAAWGRTRYRVVHGGHIHHTRLIEHPGCRTWNHNTLASKDAWANHAGFDSEQCLESVTYHRIFGQESTATVGIERVRAALAGGRK